MELILLCPIQFGFFFSFGLTALGRIPRTILNTIYYVEYKWWERVFLPCTDLRWKAFSVSSLIMLAVGFSISDICCVEETSFFTYFVESFIINRCQISTNAFSASIRDDCVLSFILLMWYVILSDSIRWTTIAPQK